MILIRKCLPLEISKRDLFFFQIEHGQFESRFGQLFECGQKVEFAVIIQLGLNIQPSDAQIAFFIFQR